MRRVFLLLEPRTPIPHLTDKFLWHRFVQTQLIIHESKTCLHDGGCFPRVSRKSILSDRRVSKPSTFHLERRFYRLVLFD